MNIEKTFTNEQILSQALENAIGLLLENGINFCECDDECEYCIENNFEIFFNKAERNKRGRV